MATRTGMAALIARLRVALDDGRTPQLFTDEQLQSFLDQHRYRLAGEMMYSDRLYTEWRSLYPNVEDGAELREAGNTVIPASGYVADFASGSFTFVLPLYNTPYLWGYAYDLNAAAADGWTQKAARPSLWSGQFGQLAMQTIKMYRQMSWTTSAPVERL